MIAELGKRSELGACRIEAVRAEAIHHVRHILDIESARSASCNAVIVCGEVAIAVGVGSGGGNMGRVKNVGIDEHKLVKGQHWNRQGPTVVHTFFLISSYHST